MVVRGALAVMIILLIAQALVHRTSSGSVPTVTYGLYPTSSLGAIYDFSAPNGTECELTYASATKASAYCIANAMPVHHVLLDAHGHYTVCRGMQCGSNPPLGTPTYTAGIRLILGDITCLTQTDGVTCHLQGHGGFHFTSTDVTRLTS